LASQLGKTLPRYGEALAKTVDPIHLRVQVDINVGSMSNSQVTGVYIESLKEIDPREELEVLIRAPLAALPSLYADNQEMPPELAVFVIDSLDEAETTTGKDNLVTLLAALSQTEGLPAWIRFLLTSRPNDRVLQQFEPLLPHKLDEMLEQNLGDIRQYVQKRVEQPAFQPRLEAAQVTLPTLVEEVKNLSKGNFLYTRLLLNDIEAGRQSLENLAELPKSLDEIYHNFLKRFSEREWEEEYQPILGTLSVVLEPVTEELLVKFTEVESDELQEDLDVLQQFLDVAEDEQEAANLCHFSPIVA
jgi:hypothetical protein